MAIVVLPRIEQENPFGELAEVISEQALPYLVKLYANKDKIARLSDTELTDFVEVLQKHAPELVVNGKINWEKVNEWAQSDDNTKLKVASYLFDAKRMREDFANAPLIAKLDTIHMAGSVNPQELNKIFVAGKMQQKLADAIGKSNLSDVHKLLLLSNIEKFAEKPELIPILERILSEAGTSQEIAKTETSGGTGGWQFSLEGSKPFGVDLGEPPQLTPPQVSPPQIPKTTKQGSGGGMVKLTTQKSQTQKQPASNSDVIKFYKDGVEYIVRPKKDGSYEVLSVKETPLQEPLFLDPVIWLSGLLGQVGPKISGVVGKIFSRGGRKGAEKEAQNVVEKVVNKKTQQVLPRSDIYSRKDIAKEVEEKFNEKIREEARQEIRKMMEEARQQYKQQFNQLLEEAKKRGQNLTDEERKNLKNLFDIQIQPASKSAPSIPMKNFEKMKDPLKHILKDLGINPNKGSLTISSDVLKQAEQLKRRYEQYKKLQERVLRVEQELKQVGNAPSPKKAELLKKAEEFRKKLNELEKQMQKEYADLVKKLHTKNLKLLKIQDVRQITPKQAETILKLHRKTPPTEQLMREEIHIGSLQPRLTKAERLQELDKTILQLLKPLQPPKPPATQTTKKQTAQTKKKSSTKKKKPKK